MTTRAQVRDQLAALVKSGPGLSTIAYLADTINPPVAHVFGREYDPRMVFGSTKAPYPFTIRVFMPRIVPIAQQKHLDEYKEPAGARSIIAAVRDEDNWGAVTVDYAQVVLVGEDVEREIGSSVYLTTDFDIEVVW